MLTPIKKETSAIYLITIGVLVALFASLPFITVRLSITASGSIRPAAEISVIRSPLSGTIKETFARENINVQRGTTLYLLDSKNLRSAIDGIQIKIDVEQKTADDIRTALKESRSRFPTANPAFQTSLYHQSWRAFLQGLHEAQTALTKAEKEFRRQKKLFETRVIAAAEFENYEFEQRKAGNHKKQVLETSQSQWESALHATEEHLRDWREQIRALELDIARYRIVAPVTGTLQNLSTVYAGTQVYANQELSQISPDTSMLVVAYVKPGDIAEMNVGMPVRLQVDAFHHQQWGLARGHIIDIGQDSKQINNQWMYEVRCMLDKSYLTHPTGRVGNITKGMTVRAHFEKGQRSLWHLLYQKADDQLNPASNPSLAAHAPNAH